MEHYDREQTRAAVLRSMEKLKTDYLDLMLLHQPFSDVYGACRALDKGQSAFFSHQGSSMVEWFAQMVEQRKTQRGGGQ